MSKTDVHDTMQLLSIELRGLRTVLDNIGAYVFTKDTAGKYTFVNPLMCELFELTSEQIIGKDDSSFYDLNVSHDLRHNDRRVMKDGATLELEEISLVKSTGKFRTYWSVKTPIRNDNAEIIGMCGISNDITERKRLELALERERGLLESVLNNVDAHIYMKDANRRYLYVNPKMEEFLGKDSTDIIGKQDEDLRSSVDADHTHFTDARVLSSGAKYSAEESFKDANGDKRYFWSTKVPLNLSGHPESLIGISTEVTELHTLREELELQATTDVLTTLYNRRYLYRAAEQEFLSSIRYDQPTSLLILDIDRFKHINDTFGHQTGDEVLRTLALHCLETIRTCDTIGRIGGEEFAILLPQTCLDEAHQLGERLCRSFTGVLMSTEPQAIDITVCIGVSSRQEKDTSVEALFTRADKALYEAKRTGRNRVCISS